MNDAIDINIAFENIESSSPLWQTVVNLMDDGFDNQWPHVDCQKVQSEINDGFFSYVRLAYFLDKMRYYKLYKQQGFKTFKDYCLKVFRKSAHYCNKIISAAQVCIKLAAAGFEKLPSCVAQALPLVKFNTYDGGGNSPLAEKWQKVLDETPENKPITSTTIAQIVDETPEKTKPLPIKVKPETYAKLEKIAQAKGVTIQEVIDDLADLLLDEIEAEPTPVDPEAEAAWEADVENLVAEYEANCTTNYPNCTTNYHVRPGLVPESG